MNEQSRFDIEKFVSDRFSAFLIGTSFIIGAFAVVVTRLKEGSELLLLANTINAVGLYLSLYFVIANYHGALTIKGEDDKALKQPHTLLAGLLKELIKFLCNPLAERLRAIHTRLIPFLFLLFWLSTWFGVLPDKWVPAVFGVSLPFLYLVVLSVKSYLCCCSQRGGNK